MSLAAVVATLPRPGKAEYVRSLGAAEVVTPDAGPLTDRVPAHSVDGVLETLGASTFAESAAVLRRGGRLCMVGALTGERLTLSAWDLVQELVLTGYSTENLDGDALRTDVAELVDWLRIGTLTVPAWETFRLAEAAEVHRRMEADQLTGRALLVP